MQLTRRGLLETAGIALTVSASGLLAACSGGAAPSATSAPAAAAPPTQPPAIAPAAPAASAKPQPAAAASPSPAAAASPSPAVAAAPSSSAAARSASAGAGKPMYQQDPQHSGRSPYAGPRQATVLRRFDTSLPEFMPSDAATPRDDFQSSSAIGPDGAVYVANFPGMLFALRDSPTARDRLDLAWRFHPPNASSFHATPALSSDGGTVYLGFASGGFNAPGKATLYALAATPSGSDAQVIWSLDLGETRVMASPTVGPDGTIYVTNSAGLLHAVSPQGLVRWTAQTGAAIKSAPALAADGTLYHATADGNMYAISPQGQVRWKFDFGEHLGPTPLVVNPNATGAGGASGIGSGASPTIGPDGTVYIGANNSNMYAVAPDGTLKWLFEAERELAGIWTTPCLSADGGTLFFGANKGGVYALNTANGSKRWQFPVYGSIYASSVLDSRGVLYTGATVEHLFALDSAQGEPLWDLDIHNQVWSAPSLRPDGTLVIADRGGLVQVIG